MTSGQTCRVAVLGAGSWGTAAAGLAAHGADVRLWARRPDLADAITTTRSNPDYLPDAVLPESVTATSDLTGAAAGADVIVMAVPSHGYREVLEKLTSVIAPSTP